MAIVVDMNVIKQFSFVGEFQKFECFGDGHINDTYKIYCRSNDGKSSNYILQKINCNIFLVPEKLMHNIEKITNYINSNSKSHSRDATLTLLPTVAGSSYYREREKSYWRAYKFIEDTVSYESSDSLETMYRAGVALGEFLKNLDGFDALELYEIIPDFHNTGKRFKDFKKAVQNNYSGRADCAKKEISFVMDRRNDMSILTNIHISGGFPTRVTHNDSKLQNILFNKYTHEAVCIIDLDTVMAGISLYDFGDSIRSGASSAKEDEKDLSKVHFRLPYFEAFTKGYIGIAKSVLTTNEINYLPQGCRIITLEQGMRFLEDYLNGDKYYKTATPNQNLDRCQNQFKLVHDMESCMDEMIKMIEMIK